MCMKINNVSSRPKSNIGVEASARDRSRFVPSTAPTIQPRARRAQPGLVPRRVEDSQQSKRRGKGRKVTRGELSTLKDVKNEGRSGNVYENKGLSDNLPDTKDDICARLHAILQRNARILQKSSALLPLFELCRMSRSLQNLETRSVRKPFGPTPLPRGIPQAQAAFQMTGWRPSGNRGCVGTIYVATRQRWTVNNGGEVFGSLSVGLSERLSPSDSNIA